MTDKTTTSLTAASALDGTELVHVVQGGNSRKATVADVAASVVLADIDLAARDLRKAGNPLILTNVDDYRELHCEFRATHGTDAGILAEVSTDNGVNFDTGASDYGVAGWLYNTTYGSAIFQDTAFPSMIIAPTGSTLTYGSCRITNHWNANGHTFATVNSGGTLSGTRSFTSERRAASLVNAIRFFSNSAHTGGRLTIVGFR